MRLATLSIILGLEIGSKMGIHREMGIKLRKKLSVLCAKVQACETRKNNPCPE